MPPVRFALGDAPEFASRDSRSFVLAASSLEGPYISLNELAQEIARLIQHTAPQPALLKPSEVTEALGLSRARVYELIGTRELPSVKIGGSIYVPRRSLEDWVEQLVRKARAQRPSSQ